MTRAAPDPAQSDEASSRRSRLATRHRRRWRIASITLVCLVVVGAAAAIAYAVADGGPPAKAAGAASAGAAPFGRDRELPAVAGKAAAERVFDHGHPLRLWVGGDSLAGSFGPALGDKLGAMGVVQTQIDYKVSSGLWGDDVRNWPKYATAQMTSADPEAVVFIIGTNDTPVVNKVDANRDGVPDWQVAYGATVGRMMDTFVGPQHRTVFWLGPPTLGTKSMDTAALELGKVMQAEASRRSPDVVYVDTYRLFSVAGGEYSRHIVDENGEDITARIADGVHFSEDGAQYLARAVSTLVETRFDVTRRADPAHPIGWTLASGSGEAVPGFRSTPRSRYRSNNNSNYYQTPRTYSGGAGGATPVTTPPYTTPVAPPPTSPPATDPPVTTPRTSPPHTTPPTTPSR